MTRGRISDLPSRWRRVGKEGRGLDVDLGRQALDRGGGNGELDGDVQILACWSMS
jgi:hypothetical protein